MSETLTKKQKVALYFKNRYNNDQEYREWRREYSRNAYKRKTHTCTQCHRRYKTEELELTQQDYNSPNFICFICKNPDLAHYTRNRRGRPAKTNGNTIEYGSE